MAVGSGGGGGPCDAVVTCNLSRFVAIYSCAYGRICMYVCINTGSGREEARKQAMDSGRTRKRFTYIDSTAESPERERESNRERESERDIFTCRHSSPWILPKNPLVTSIP